MTGCIGLVGNIQARLRSRAGTARARLAAIEAERRDLLAGWRQAVSPGRRGTFAAAARVCPPAPG